MPRTKTHYAGEGGWSDWTVPEMEGFRLTCCVCGMTHEMEFQALRVRLYHTEDTFEADPKPKVQYRVRFRVREHKRATAQVRRAMRRRGEL